MLTVDLLVGTVDGRGKFGYWTREMNLDLEVLKVMLGRIWVRLDDAGKHAVWRSQCLAGHASVNLTAM